jgi:glutathione S-transferase
MKLFGTPTSPFVRRVRIVAAEAGVPLEMTDTRPDAGQAELRRASPIWKVPVIEVDGRVIFDSRAIIDWITTTRGWGGVEPPRDRWHEGNLVNAIDGALDSAIQVFYLRREGMDVGAMPFAHRQRDRITDIFGWLGAEQDAGRLGGFGLAEISLCCTLDWMEFRKTYDVAALGGRFDALRARLGARDSVASTRPHE